MAPPEGRRLIVNADDFGRSHSINQAVIRAHREGILTTASLMVTGEAFEEAVALAEEHPTLGVGLHLTLLMGRAALDPAEILGLVDSRGRFSDNPVATGVRYFFQRSLRPQLEREIRAQFARFRETGLTLDHVNGHLHLHLHPVVFAVFSGMLDEWGVRRVRLTRDPLGLNLRLAKGRYAYRLSHALVFSELARRARRTLDDHGVTYTDRVIGLLQNGLVNESFVSGLIPALPSGTTELYSHPSLDEFRSEYEALMSASVRRAVEDGGIRLIRYQDI